MSLNDEIVEEAFEAKRLVIFTKQDQDYRKLLSTNPKSYNPDLFVTISWEIILHPDKEEYGR